MSTKSLIKSNCYFLIYPSLVGIKDNKLLDMQTYFCVSISHVEISCNKLLMSVDFSMFAYLEFIIFELEAISQLQTMMQKRYKQQSG